MNTLVPKQWVGTHLWATDKFLWALTRVKIKDHYIILPPTVLSVMPSTVWMDVHREEDTFYWYKPRRQEAGVPTGRGNCVSYTVVSPVEGVVHGFFEQISCDLKFSFFCVVDLQNDMHCV